jgi:3-oxoacyl-[acyl-carrier protein] reductase
MCFGYNRQKFLWSCFEMGKRLEGKVAIVTGASRGIGKAICLEFAKEAATVVLAARAVEKLRQTAEEVTSAGGKAEIVVTELTQEQSIKNLVKVTSEKSGRLDILVNCAGVTHSAALEETETADWDRCHLVNSRGPFILCRQALGLLKQSPAGYIINIASVVGVKGYALQSAYTASKHALRGMTMSLAQAVRPDIAKEDLIKPGEIAELAVYLVTHKGNAVIDELHIRRAAAAPWF